MILAHFRANVDFSQWSLSIEGMPVESSCKRDDNTGTAKLSERRGRNRGASCFAAEMRKIIGVKKST